MRLAALLDLRLRRHGSVDPPPGLCRWLVLLPCPRYVFIVDVYADLALVIFLDPEVFMMKPVDQANR